MDLERILARRTSAQVRVDLDQILGRRGTRGVIDLDRLLVERQLDPPPQWKLKREPGRHLYRLRFGPRVVHGFVGVVSASIWVGGPLVVGLARELGREVPPTREGRQRLFVHARDRGLLATERISATSDHDVSVDKALLPDLRSGAAALLRERPKLSPALLPDEESLRALAAALSPRGLRGHAWR